MIERKEDRRIQRTKQMLRESLIALVVQRGEWESITIQDIADHANISRTTFYLHYKDKDDLLFRSMEDMYDTLYKEVMERKAMSELHQDTSDFDHVAQYADFYRVMLSPKGSASFIIRVESYLARVFEEAVLELPESRSADAVSLKAVAHYMAGAEIGLIRWWLNNGMQLTPAQLSGIMYKLCLEGISTSVGVQALTVFVANAENA
jgi:AcrR family transcriptional regulator